MTWQLDTTGFTESFHPTLCSVERKSGGSPVRGVGIWIYSLNERYVKFDYVTLTGERIEASEVRFVRPATR